MGGSWAGEHCDTAFRWAAYRAEAENYRVENERAQAETEALSRAQANSGTTRAIVVYMHYNGGDRGNPSFMDRTIYEVFETLGWDALRRLVEAD